jgi:hypothetical protein
MNPVHSNARLVIFILLGLVIGGILGESLGLVLEQIGVATGAGVDNPVRNLFVKAFELDLGINNGGVIDLYMIKLRLGVAFKFNVVSILGVWFSLHVMKWSGRHT